MSDRNVKIDYEDYLMGRRKKSPLIPLFLRGAHSTNFD
jgi:hypothetical protein